MTHRPTASADPDLIHASTRTMLCPNRDPAGVKPTRIVLQVTRMEIRWLDGDVAVRFSGKGIDVTPRKGQSNGRG